MRNSNIFKISIILFLIISFSLVFNLKAFADEEDDVRGEYGEETEGDGKPPNVIMDEDGDLILVDEEEDEAEAVEEETPGKRERKKVILKDSDEE